MIKDFSTSSFIVGIIVGVLISCAWFFGNSSPYVSMSLKQSHQSVATSTTSVTQQSGAVSVANQPAGDTVIVESVTVPPPGVWVAVREISGNDLGNVLGALHVDGPRSSVSIPLLRSTEPGQSYAVELYRDDAGGAFDPNSNSVYVDFSTGAPVIEHFTTTP